MQSILRQNYHIPSFSSTQPQQNVLHHLTPHFSPCIRMLGVKQTPLLPNWAFQSKADGKQRAAALLTQCYLGQVQAVHPGDLAQGVWGDEDHHDADGAARPAWGKHHQLPPPPPQGAKSLLMILKLTCPASQAAGGAGGTCWQSVSPPPSPSSSSAAPSTSPGPPSCSGSGARAINHGSAFKTKPESSPNFACGAQEDEVSSGPRGTTWLLQSTRVWFYTNLKSGHALACRYLVGAVQGADEKGDLLHHRQVLLQVLQLLEEPRWPQVDFILVEK